MTTTQKLTLFALGLLLLFHAAIARADPVPTPTPAYRLFLPVIVLDNPNTTLSWWFWAQEPGIPECSGQYWCTIVDTQMCVNTWDDTAGGVYWFGCTNEGIVSHSFPYGHVLRWEAFPELYWMYTCLSNCSATSTVNDYPYQNIDTLWVRNP